MTNHIFNKTISETERKTIIELFTKIINREKLTKDEINDAGYIRHKLMGLIQ